MSRICNLALNGIQRRESYERSPYKSLKETGYSGSNNFQIKKKVLLAELPPSGAIAIRSFTFHEKKREHKDRHMQIRKRTVKLYWLMRSIANEGIIAREKLGARRK